MKLDYEFMCRSQLKEYIYHTAYYLVRTNMSIYHHRELNLMDRAIMQHIAFNLNVHLFLEGSEEKTHWFVTTWSELIERLTGFNKNADDEEKILESLLSLREAKYIEMVDLNEEEPMTQLKFALGKNFLHQNGADYYCDNLLNKLTDYLKYLKHTEDGYEQLRALKKQNKELGQLPQ